MKESKWLFLKKKKLVAMLYALDILLNKTISKDYQRNKGGTRQNLLFLLILKVMKCFVNSRLCLCV